MNKLLLSFMLVFLFSLTFVSGAIQTLGTYKTDECITLKQLCGECTFNNISSVALPNSTSILTNVAMTKNGIEYTYSFCDTSVLGRYIVNGYGDLNGDSINVPWAYDFYITLNGKEPAEGILVVVFIIIFMIIFGLMIFSLLNALTHVLALDMDIKDTALMWVSYFLMWIFYYFSFEYLGNNFINEILELAIDVGGITHLILPLIGFMVSFIMTNLKFKQKQKITY